jgi:hypothetical protein
MKTTTSPTRLAFGVIVGGFLFAATSAQATQETYVCGENQNNSLVLVAKSDGTYESATINKDKLKFCRKQGNVVIFGACAEGRVLEFDLVLREVRLNDKNPLYMSCKQVKQPTRIKSDTYR